ncbi:hypothetical protein PR048_007456 [Dryococelus australis]|uniref:Uncharacterized protein n=1 Tax=Dryococelus australis TaxID=614101 RepID=A0ABQ9HUA4_9NEOP|nr:hypothetical protein PR048_007456 [Dryococelus australis]
MQLLTGHGNFKVKLHSLHLVQSPLCDVYGVDDTVQHMITECLKTYDIRQWLHGITATGIKGRGKWEIPEKTRRPTASSGTIPTCENLVTRPGIEPGSRWWEASVITGHPPRPQEGKMREAKRWGVVSELVALY